MTKIFIDGEHGTTGLEIHKRLKQLTNLTLLSLPYKDRHNLDFRIDLLKQADITILCLPDKAAHEIFFLTKNYNTRIIDSSTAFRTDSNWVYGFSEMTKTHKEKIKNASLVSNPGCYAVGSISLLRPLREKNILERNSFIHIYAVSGYTGGGKTLISQMRDRDREDFIDANYFTYNLNLEHKHLPEIMKHGLLDKAPIFVPNVAAFPRGMIVNIPLHLNGLKKNVNIEAIEDIFQDYYQNTDMIQVIPHHETIQKIRLNPEELAATDRLKIYICANKNKNIINLCSIFDNLGKGASGSAVQNLKLMIDHL